MKSKIMQIKQYLCSKKNSRKNFILSVVALVEVLAILIVSTYAWVESASTIIIQSDGDKPIDSFVYTNAVIDSSSEDGEIQLSKFFRKSGNMHLSSAISPEGSSFYFPRVQTSAASLGTNLYRAGTVSDKNTNYLTFSIKVEARNEEVKLVFDRAPQIKINGSIVNDNSVRLAVDDGTSTKIFSNNAAVASTVTINGAQQTAAAINSFASYAGATGEKVLTIDAGATKIVKFTLWLEDPSRAKEVNVEISDLRLLPSDSTSASIFFLDKTSRYNSVNDTPTSNGWGWTDNNDNVMWIYDAKSGNTRKMSASVDESGFTRWAGSVVKKSLDSNSKLIFYNCLPSVSQNAVSTNYICKWETTFAQLRSTNPTYRTYTAYGNMNTSKVGYGTWESSVDLIVLDVDGSDIPDKPTSLTDAVNVWLTDGQSSRLEMYYDNVDGNYCWRTFAPNISNQNVFHFIHNGTTYNIAAYNRNTTQSESTFKITYAANGSSGKGYWVPPATVKVMLGNDSYTSDTHTPMGTVSVSGGAPNSSTVKVTAGASVQLFAAGSGDYGFYGWYKNDPACTGDPTYTNASPLIDAPGENQSVIYYAKFVRLYTVTLHSIADNETVDSTKGGTVKINNGTEGETAQLKVFEGGSATIHAIKNESHEFLGWFTDNNWTHTTPISDVTGADPVIKNIREDKVYFARFKIKTFTIEAEARYETLNNGNNSGATGGTVQFTAPKTTASGATASVQVNYDQSATFKANEKASDGYEFAGWYTDEACTSPAPAVSGNSDAYKSASYIKEHNVSDYKLYAKFNLKQYEVNAYAVSDGNVENDTFGQVCLVTNNTEGTYGAKAQDVIKHGATVSFRAKAKTGATFDGWYSDSICKTPYTAATTGVTINSSTKTITLTIKSVTKIYAKFTPQKYDVTAYAGEGGQVKVNKSGSSTNDWSVANGNSKLTSVNYGTTVTFEAQPANASNTEFEGWYTDAAYTNKVTQNGEAVGAAYSETVTGNVERYAKFITKQEKIIYYYNPIGSSTDTVNIWYWEEGGRESAKADGYDWDKNHPTMEIVDGYNNVWQFKLPALSSNSNKFIFNKGTTYTLEDSSNNMFTTGTNSWSKFPPPARTVTVNSNSYASSITVKDNVTTITATTSNTSGTINSGKKITLTANVKTGYVFESFTVKNASGTTLTTLTTNGGTYTVPDSNITIVANIRANNRIYLKNDASWGKPRVHLWGSSGHASWGTDAENMIYDSSLSLWYYTLPTTNATYAVFYDGNNDSKKSADLVVTTNYVYNNKTYYYLEQSGSVPAAKNIQITVGNGSVDNPVFTLEFKEDNKTYYFTNGKTLSNGKCTFTVPSSLYNSCRSFTIQRRDPNNLSGDPWNTSRQNLTSGTSQQNITVNFW